MVSKFGAEWYVYHRVDLHTELKRLALDTEGNAPPARFRLSAEVVDVNCEAGTLKLADGSNHQKDLIVAADGVHVSAGLSLLERNIDVLNVTSRDWSGMLRVQIPRRPLLAFLFFAAWYQHPSFLRTIEQGKFLKVSR